MHRLKFYITQTENIVNVITRFLNIPPSFDDMCCYLSMHIFIFKDLKNRIISYMLQLIV